MCQLAYSFHSIVPVFPSFILPSLHPYPSYPHTHLSNFPPFFFPSPLFLIFYLLLSLYFRVPSSLNLCIVYFFLSLLPLTSISFQPHHSSTSLFPSTLPTHLPICLPCLPNSPSPRHFSSRLPGQKLFRLVPRRPRLLVPRRFSSQRDKDQEPGRMREGRRGV